MNVEPAFQTMSAPGSGLITLQAIPKTGSVATAGATGTAAPASLGAAPTVRLGAAASAGAYAAAPVDSFATRASQHVDLAPPTQAITQGGLDVPGFLLLALAVAGFALRQLADHRR